MTRLTRTVLAAATALVALTACSGSGGDRGESATDAGSAAAPSAPDAGSAEESSGGQGSEDSGQDGSLVTAALQTAAGRDIIHTVTLSITTEDVTAAATSASSVAASAGGFVADESTRGDDFAHLTLRIPVEAHTDAIADLERLGDVAERTRTAEDVTDQVVDTESRIDSQRASIARTRQLLETATDIDQIIRIEDELSSREADLDALLRTREELSSLASLATVNITFRTAVTDDEPVQASGFLAGLRNGWDAFVGALNAGATVLGAALPFLVTAAAIAAPVLWWRRRRQTVPSTPAVAPSDAPSA